MGAAIRGPSGLIDLGAEPLTIGRSRSCRLVLTNSQISSKHAEIQPLAGGRYQVLDVGSTNGTSVNGVKLGAGQPQPLNAGDTIMLGGSGGIELRFELTPDAPWQANQPQAAGVPGGFGISDPAAPPAQPFGGGIGQPSPGAAGFPPAPGAFGPPGQPAPGAPQFPPSQDAFPAPPAGFGPPNQFAPPGSQPAAGPNFPPPGGPGTAGFDAPAGAPPAFFPPPGGPQFGPPGGPPAPGFAPPGAPGQVSFGPPGGPPTPAGFAPPGGPGAPPFGGPGGPPPAGPGYPPGPGFPPGGPGGPQYGPPGAPPPGFVPPGGPPPAKKRTGRNIFLLLGSIIVLILIVVGIVFGVRTVLNKKTTPTPTPRPGASVHVVPAMVRSPMLLSAAGAAGQHAHYQIVIRMEGAAAAVVVSSV